MPSLRPNATVISLQASIIGGNLSMSAKVKGPQLVKDITRLTELVLRLCNCSQELHTSLDLVALIFDLFFALQGEIAIFEMIDCVAILCALL